MWRGLAVLVVMGGCTEPDFGSVGTNVRGSSGADAIHFVSSAYAFEGGVSATGSAHCLTLTLLLSQTADACGDPASLALLWLPVRSDNVYQTDVAYRSHLAVRADVAFHDLERDQLPRHWQQPIAGNVAVRFHGRDVAGAALSTVRGVATGGFWASRCPQRDLIDTGDSAAAMSYCGFDQRCVDGQVYASDLSACSRCDYRRLPQAVHQCASGCTVDGARTWQETVEQATELCR